MSFIDTLREALEQYCNKQEYQLIAERSGSRLVSIVDADNSVSLNIECHKENDQIIMAVHGINRSLLAPKRTPIQRLNINPKLFTYTLIASLLDEHVNMMFWFNSRSNLSNVGYSFLVKRSIDSSKIGESKACINTGLSNFDWAPDDQIYVYSNPKLSIKFTS